MEDVEDRTRNEGGYKRLQVYQLAHRLAVEVHIMSLDLPKFEMFEQGGQIRRSSKSVSAQIVEGFCLRNYKKEFVLYLVRAQASAEETVEHLTMLFETGSLRDKARYEKLKGEYETLCRKLHRFIQGVIEEHIPPFVVREPGIAYERLGEQ